MFVSSRKEPGGISFAETSTIKLQPNVPIYIFGGLTIAWPPRRQLLCPPKSMRNTPEKRAKSTGQKR